MEARRERQIIRSFIAFSDSLVQDFDVLDLSIRLAEDCARLLNVSAVGLLLADASETLHLLAATSEEARSLEAFQLQRDEGPCLDCYHTGQPVSVADLSAAAERWPRFVPAAREQGFASVHAIPLKLQQERLGTLGLFGSEVGTLEADDNDLARALAHVASIAILQKYSTVSEGSLIPGLQAAVASRRDLELAKGVLAGQLDITMQQAFARLRSYAHHHDRHLSDVARGVVDDEPGLRVSVGEESEAPSGPPHAEAGL